jgi:ribosomal protein S18 acetylase RimI-like enzyme
MNTTAADPSPERSAHRPGPHAVRPVHAGDLPVVERTFGRAFHDDPVWRWVIDDNGRFEARAGRALGAVTRMLLGHGHVWMSRSGEAVATWAPPGTHRLTARHLLPVAHRLLPAVGWPGIRRMGSLEEVDRHHPKEPHWYLAVLGTDPSHHGRGYGSAVMEPVLAMADEEGVGCYLESSKESNVAFYARHGFTVTERLALAKGTGPSLWLMWRDPR